jgi:hypothetical protein
MAGPVTSNATRPRRIRRSAQVPGDMWVYFAIGIVQWVVFAGLIVFATDWPVVARIGATILLIPVAYFIVRLLSRWMGE